MTRADLCTVDYFAAESGDTLLMSADVPRKTAEDAAAILGKALCRVRGMENVNTEIYDGFGNHLFRVLIKK